MDTAASVPAIKQLGCESESSSTSVEVINTRIYTATPLCLSMA
jgi:hypothetical protein